jgi:hypothetical protein
MARSASTTAYAATMAELASFANTAYVPNYFAGTPSMDAVGAPGTAAFVTRGDHVHPSDTSRLALAGGTMTGLLTLSGVPSVSLHAATKGYVDTATGGSTAAIPGTSYCDNGGFAINQRAYVSGTALAAAAFGHDRWKGGASGCTYTFTQSGNPATTITITAGALQQVVEGAALVGGTYTLSWTGTAQGRVGAGSYAASPLTASGITASANTTIEFNAGTLGRVKFEVGSTATPWVALPPRYDLANCQRFYQIVVPSLRAMSSLAGSIYDCTVSFPQMRALPSVIAGPIGTFANASAANLVPSSVSSARYEVTATSTGDFYAMNYTFNLSADL